MNRKDPGTPPQARGKYVLGSTLAIKISKRGFMDSYSDIRNMVILNHSDRLVNLLHAINNKHYRLALEPGICAMLDEGKTDDEIKQVINP